MANKNDEDLMMEEDNSNNINSNTMMEYEKVAQRNLIEWEESTVKPFVFRHNALLHLSSPTTTTTTKNNTKNNTKKNNTKNDDNHENEKEENFLDFIFYTHTVRQCAIHKKTSSHQDQKKNSSHSGSSSTGGDGDGNSYSAEKNHHLNEHDLHFMIDFLFYFHCLQHDFFNRHSTRLNQIISLYHNNNNNNNNNNSITPTTATATTTDESENLLCIMNEKTSETYNGIRITMLCYQLQQQQQQSSPLFHLTVKKCIKFLQLYPNVFTIHSYSTHNQFVSLDAQYLKFLKSLSTDELTSVSTTTTTTTKDRYPPFIPLYQKSVLCHSDTNDTTTSASDNNKNKNNNSSSSTHQQHVQLIHDILKEHERVQWKQHKRANAAMPLGTLKTVLFEKHHILPKKIFQFLSQRSNDFDIVTREKNGHSYFMIRSLQIRVMTRNQNNNITSNSGAAVVSRHKKRQNESEEKNVKSQVDDHNDGENSSSGDKDMLPLFSLPKNYEIVCTEDSTMAADWIRKHILDRVVVQSHGDDDDDNDNNNNTMAVGMDCEWDVTRPLLSLSINPHLTHHLKKETRYAMRDHIHPKYFDTIQIAVENSCLIYQTLQNKCDEMMHEVLCDLMNNEHVFKCWCSHHSDISKLKIWLTTFEGSQRPSDGSENWADSWSKSIVELDEDCKGAAILCKHYLGMDMIKDYNIQLSRWSRRRLDNKQQEYAAMDSYLNLKIYEAQERSGAFDAGLNVTIDL